MTGDSQDKVISFLGDPATHRGTPPDHVETHGAHVFLAGDTALKVKKAVHFDYLDYTALATREKMLRRELELNRPAAPQIYRDVVPVTRDGDGLALDGDGETVEWVLRMHRFPKEDELSEVAARGALTDELADRLGHEIAAYHDTAPRRDGTGADRMAAILDELESAFAGMKDTLGPDRITAFARQTRAAFDHASPLLDSRAAEGHLRRCHGDLHLRNLVLIDGRPVLFDALEFDEELGTCDVLYDLAFLVMDLLNRGLSRPANIVLNAWLFAHQGRQDAGLAALPVFLALRAGIRAMVTVQTGAGDPAEMRDAAQGYLKTALDALNDPGPRLVAVGGLSGTGKTTLARRLAPAIGRQPGAVHLRSDLERKALAGVAPEDRLPADSYTAEAARAVHTRLTDRARYLLAAGQSVLLDATFLSPDERRGVGQLAKELSVPFTGLWLEAPVETLTRRVTARQGDASDADADVVRRQTQTDTGPADWPRIDTSGGIEVVEAAAAQQLGVTPRT
ncbi:AAA family ATPase [Roseovarius sp.]|uniref:bifunctional aminoglycoside phosphotransferase/ATP-binding protein n=1 Tax=Roseovarius sp. TaxID=1486281 RepID=UPI003BAC02C5